MDASLADPQSAIETLLPVLDANPNSTNTLYALGYMYNAGIGDPNQASDVLDRCVAIDPSNDVCAYYYGRVLIRQERYEEAAEQLAAAVDILERRDEISPRYMYWAAEAQINLGNCTTAVNYINPGIEEAIDQDDEQLQSDLEVLQRECGAFDFCAAYTDAKRLTVRVL